ncbi:Plant self-incompatibility S1 [Spatholobus suberectus]|nr:Plant self-incompatibility S1 [Spatholobus suberectus]
MSLFARSVFILWVLMAVLSLANNAMAANSNVVITATNSLDGNLELNVQCPNFDPEQHTLAPATSYEWIYSGGVPSRKSPFFCFFRWQGASHSFDMCTPNKDTGCQQVTWYIKQNGPCRYFGHGAGNYNCFKWN